MLADRYDLSLSTASAAARDAYVEGADLALRLYPGALAAFDRALEADPGFAMAWAGKAQVLMREGNGVAARAAQAQANTQAASLAHGLSSREASHIALFDRVFSGQTEAAVTAVHDHLSTWPRDALVVAAAANPNGVIGSSGRIGQKRQIAVLMDGLAPHYGDDPWFLAYHAMALSEDGQLAAARAKIDRSVLLKPDNAHATHGFAHVCYESGEPDTARSYLSGWLKTYPRNAFFHGHLSWHLALCELQAANWDEATRLYRDAISLGHHSGGPQQQMSDATAFLWRSELAGHPRDAAAWRAMSDYADEALPRPTSGLADLHVVLAQAVLGASPDRAAQIEDLARAGRYASSAYLPALSRGFAAFEKKDFPAAIEALAPLAEQSERIGGSRAQHDLIEFTLLKAYLEANRLDEARQALGKRRQGASGVPVAGVEPVWPA